MAVFGGRHDLLPMITETVKNIVRPSVEIEINTCTFFSEHSGGMKTKCHHCAAMHVPKDQNNISFNLVTLELWTFN